MPKINWHADQSDDEQLTADDIDSAEAGFAQYAGEIPPGGVYRFKVRRIKFTKASTGTKGLKALLLLDGSWKPQHRKYDGCPLWDNIWMTKASAAFVKAFAAAIGVSAADIVSKVVVDEDDVVTKIGRKSVGEADEVLVYIAVRPDEYEGTPRLDKAGTGYQIVESEDVPDDEPEEEARPAKKTAKAAPAKATGKAKGKNKGQADEPPF